MSNMSNAVVAVLSVTGTGSGGDSIWSASGDLLMRDCPIATKLPSASRWHKAACQDEHAKSDTV
jgi:hypothetical protein